MLIFVHGNIIQKSFIHYSLGNVEFLDVVIGSKAPALAEVRNHAKVEMKTLVDKLETLKKEIDDRCHQLVFKMSERVRHWQVILML